MEIDHTSLQEGEAAKPLPGQGRAQHRAYALVLSTDGYLTAVLQMHLALRRLGAIHPTVVFASAGVSDLAVQRLQGLGVPVRRLLRSVDPGDVTRSANVAGGMAHWAFTFDKLRLFEQTEFSKLVYLDSDMLLLSAPDELFERPHMSAVASGRMLRPDWVDLNSGVLVIEPTSGGCDALLAHMDATRQRVQARQAGSGGAPGPARFGDQDVLQTAHPHWPVQSELHLDEQFNMFVVDLDECVASRGYTLDQSGSGHKPVRIVHFAGPHKPWTRRYWWRDYLRAINPLRPAPARARVLRGFARSYREAARALR